jgi:hypothetical protein
MPVASELQARHHLEQMDRDSHAPEPDDVVVQQDDAGAGARAADIAAGRIPP